MIKTASRHSIRASFFRTAAAATLLLAGLSAAPAAEAPLVRLARIGPWSGISGLIGYRGRLWFVNSVKYVNHNSADVYSYDPKSGTHRYETHLFSQDAGEPAVLDGVLYWPSEDSRWSAGRGEFMATDGRAWRWGFLPEGLAFHVHAMAAVGGALYAAPSAWRAGLQRSDDGGGSWRIVHDQPTPEGKVSRITGLAGLGGRLYGGLVTWHGEGVNLLRLEGGAVRPVPGWPKGRAVIAPTSWRGHLYAVNAARGGRALWRTSGRGAERIAALDGRLVRDLAAGPDAIWAVTAGGDGGALWRSADGLAWSRVQVFADAQPADLAVFGGRVYMGAIGPGSRGSLWGPAPPARADEDEPPGRLPRTQSPIAPEAVPAAIDRLDRLLADAAKYPDHGREILAQLHVLARTGDRRVGDYLSRRLEGTFPDGDLAMFGGSTSVPAVNMGRWYLMWAMAMVGHGRVPAKYLAAPLTQPRNGAGKYLEPAPAAAWAVARLGQNDATTLAALIRRLGRAEDPQWLEGDIVGALTALSGERFGYDHEAWRRWWRGRKGPRKKD